VAVPIATEKEQLEIINKGKQQQQVPTTTGNEAVDTLAPVAESSAQAEGVDPAVLQALWHTESSSNPNIVNSKFADIKGQGQVREKTFNAPEVMGFGRDDPRYTEGANENGINVELEGIASARYFDHMLKTFGQNIYLALTAYNLSPTKLNERMKIASLTPEDIKSRADFERLIVPILPGKESKAYALRVAKHYKKFNNSELDILTTG